MRARLPLILLAIALPAAGVEVHPVGPSRDRQTLQESGKYYVEPVSVIMVRSHRAGPAVPEKVTYESVFVGERRTTDGYTCYLESHHRADVATRLPNGDQTYPVSVVSREIPCPEKS